VAWLRADLMHPLPSPQAVDRNARSLPAEEALRLATNGGAKAIGR
jgi:cytosine/adenosine deaminase-related metal-dependent hydrolase